MCAFFMLDIVHLVDVIYVNLQKSNFKIFWDFIV